MNCPACGTAHAPTAAYCSACGARLGGTPLVPVHQPATAAIVQATTMPATSAAIQAPAALGTMLNDRYRVVRVLDEGAFGRVYLAKDMQDFGSALLVVKELLATAFVTPEQQRQAVAWFKQEANALLALEHAGIPRIYSYWTAQPASGPFYLAMEYIPGPTLEQLLQSAGGRLPWPRTVEWGIALCETLTYLHGHLPPFIFRDLKPTNIILDERTNRPTLIDFGLSRRLTATTGTAAGVDGYMPYEQAAGHAEPRSDLYALGATLHTLVTGQHPDAEYTRLTRGGLGMQDAMRALFPSAQRLVPDLPVVLAQVIARATAFSPAERYPTATAMATALRHVVATIPTYRLAQHPAFAQPVPRRSALGRVALALVAIVALAGGLLAGGLAGLAIAQRALEPPLPAQLAAASAATPYSKVLAATTHGAHAGAPSAATLIAAANPRVLELDRDAYPAGAVITHRHVDATAAAVDAEQLFGPPNREGERYRQLRFAGALYESVRLPRFHGASRRLSLMATIFPSAGAALHALTHDAAPRGCHAPPRSALPAGARACTFGGAGQRIAGMYVSAAVGNVEYVVVGDVLAGSTAAQARAVRDATVLAAHEAEHLRHVLALAHGCLAPASRRAGCHATSPNVTVPPAARPVVETAPADARISAVRVTLLDATGHKKLTTVTAGHTVRLRVRWTITQRAGIPGETITWRITRQGRRLVDDHTADLAVSGTSYWDDLLTVDSAWAGGSRYTLTVIVTAGEHTAQAHTSFTVAR